MWTLRLGVVRAALFFFDIVFIKGRERPLLFLLLTVVLVAVHCSYRRIFLFLLFPLNSNVTGKWSSPHLSDKTGCRSISKAQSTSFNQSLPATNTDTVSSWGSCGQASCVAFTARCQVMIKTLAPPWSFGGWAEALQGQGKSRCPINCRNRLVFIGCLQPIPCPSAESAPDFQDWGWPESRLNDGGDCLWLETIRLKKYWQSGGADLTVYRDSWAVQAELKSTVCLGTQEAWLASQGQQMPEKLT